MKIKSMQIRNYKSFLDSGELEFSQINVIIGENNSGKSTLLNAIYKLQEPNADKPLRKKTDSAHVEFRFTDLNKRFWHLTGDKDVKVEIQIDSSERPSYYAYEFAQPNTRNGINNFSNNLPNNLIYPFFSTRMKRGFSEQINLGIANSVSADHSNLSAKIDRYSSPNSPIFDYYQSNCRDILGIMISAESSPNGKLAGYPLDAGNQIYITDMGTGVPNVSALVGALGETKSKIFLIEEIENDLHPKSIRKLLGLIKDSALKEGNQFFISTHSNLVLTELGAMPETSIFHIKCTIPDDRIPISIIEKVDNSIEARLEILRELGYSLADLEMYEGWLILEESSAQTLIKFIITYAFPKLRRLRLVSANGRDKVEAAFDDFNRIFLFQHLETVYKNRAWILIDGDVNGQKIINKMRIRYASWPENHFRHLSAPAIEYFYPDDFAELGINMLDIQDEKTRTSNKKQLIVDLESWLYNDPPRGLEALKFAASEIFAFLEDIQNTLYPETAS